MRKFFENLFDKKHQVSSAPKAIEQRPSNLSDITENVDQLSDFITTFKKSQEKLQRGGVKPGQPISFIGDRPSAMVYAFRERQGDQAVITIPAEASATGQEVVKIVPFAELYDPFDMTAALSDQINSRIDDMTRGRGSGNLLSE